MAHTPHADLAKRVQGAEAKIKVGGIYYHWRNPDQHYRVIGIAINEDTEELMVMYEMLTGTKPLAWVRRLRGDDGWLTPVSRNGAEIPRFQLVRD